MLRRALVLAFLVLAVLGLGQTAVAHDISSADGQACCACEDDGDAQDGCCSAAQCPCVGQACASDGAVQELRATLAVIVDAAWIFGRDQVARDRHIAPPTRPPIA